VKFRLPETKFFGVKKRGQPPFSPLRKKSQKHREWLFEINNCSSKRSNQQATNLRETGLAKAQLRQRNLPATSACEPSVEKQFSRRSDKCQWQQCQCRNFAARRRSAEDQPEKASPARPSFSLLPAQRQTWFIVPFSNIRLLIA
jgi:hypothetical protein